MGEHKPEPPLGHEQDQERADERALFARYKANPTPQDEDRLVEKYRALVYKIVHKFRGHSEHFDDLVQVGTMGLLYAIRRFDLDKEYRFSTYAWQTIQGEIQRYFRDKTWAVNVPRDLKERSHKVFSAVNEHQAQTGHEPTVGEIVEKTGMTEESVQEALELGSAYHPQSFMDHMRDMDSGYAILDDAIGSGGGGLGNSGGGEQLDMRSTKRAVFWAGVMRTLEEAEAEVIRLYFFDDFTQKEIADRMGTSQMNVSRIMKKAQNKLRGILVPEDFEG